MSFIALPPQIFGFILCKWRLMAPLAGFDLWSALANGLVAIQQLLFLVDKARSQGVAYLKRTLYGLDFLFSQFTSADTIQHPVVLAHGFLLDG
jgi:hypothetical protein